MYRNRKKLWLFAMGVILILTCVGCEGASNERRIKVACIGDSITYGDGVTNWETENYPVVLQNILGNEYEVVNFGFGGACVNPEGDIPYVNQSLYQQSLDFDADIIVFMLGTNDAKGINWTSEHDFMRDYMDLMESYSQDGRAPKVYIVLCAEGYNNPDPASEEHIQPDRIDKIVETIRNTHIENGKIIDIHSLTEAHPEWFVKDGIHPDTAGTKAIAEMIAEAIKAEKE